MDFRRKLDVDTGNPTIVADRQVLLRLKRKVGSELQSQSLRIQLTLKLNPRLLKLAPHLADSSGADAVLASGCLRGFARSQARRNVPFAPGQTREPLADVDASCCRFGGAGMAILDQDLSPLARFLVKAIQTVDGEALAALSILGADILDVQAAANLAAVAGLPDRVLGQRRGVDDIVESTVDQPDKRDPTVGDDFGDQLLTAFGTFATEGMSSLFVNEGEQGKELFGDLTGARLAAAGFGGCDHWATS
jgi:hypothetical protein